VSSRKVIKQGRKEERSSRQFIKEGHQGRSSRKERRKVTKEGYQGRKFQSDSNNLDCMCLFF
jgi:hypothetical protein